MVPSRWSLNRCSQPSISRCCGRRSRRQSAGLLGRFGLALQGNDSILAAEHKTGRKGCTSGGKAWGLWTHSKPQPDNRGGYWALSRALWLGWHMAAKKCPFLTAPGQPGVGIPVTGTRRRRAGAYCFLCCDHYLKLPSRPCIRLCRRLLFGHNTRWRCGWVRLSGSCRFGVVPAGYGMRVTSISMTPASTFVNAGGTALCADGAAGTITAETPPA